MIKVEKLVARLNSYLKFRNVGTVEVNEKSINAYKFGGTVIELIVNDNSGNYYTGTSFIISVYVNEYKIKYVSGDRCNYSLLKIIEGGLNFYKKYGDFLDNN